VGNRVARPIGWRICGGRVECITGRWPTIGQSKVLGIMGRRLAGGVLAGASKVSIKLASEGGALEPFFVRELLGHVEVVGNPPPRTLAFIVLSLYEGHTN